MWGSTSHSIDDIFAAVLPSKSVAFRGIGVIRKPSKSRSNAEVDSLRKEVEEYKEKNQVLEDRLADMERKLNLLLNIHQKSLDTSDNIGEGLDNANETGDGDTSNEGKLAISIFCRCASI